MIKSRFIRNSLWLTASFGAAAGWSTLLWPPVKFFYSQPANGFWVTLGQLFSPTNKIFPDGIFLGWFFILSTLVLSLVLPIVALRILGALMRYVELSEADISLLSLDISLRFNHDLSQTTVVRDQLFHANQAGSTAYHYKQTAHNPYGKIIASTFEMETAVDNIKLTKEFSITSTDRSFDAIEIFNRDLPTGLIATYLPDWMVRPLYHHTKFLDKVIVRRNGRIVLENEHNGEEAIYELNASRTSKNVTIELDFPLENAPHPDDVRSFIIKGNVVFEIWAKNATSVDRRKFTAELSQLDKGSSVRLQWRNKRLGEVKKSDEETGSVGSKPGFLIRIARVFRGLQAPSITIVRPD